MQIHSKEIHTALLIYSSMLIYVRNLFFAFEMLCLIQAHNGAPSQKRDFQVRFQHDVLFSCGVCVFNPQQQTFKWMKELCKTKIREQRIFRLDYQQSFSRCTENFSVIVSHWNPFCIGKSTRAFKHPTLKSHQRVAANARCLCLSVLEENENFLCLFYLNPFFISQLIIMQLGKW